MEDGSFNLKIYSPVGAALQERVRWATIPTLTGEVTVLPDHCKYISVLGVGVLSFQTVNGSSVSQLVIRRGSCYFADNELSVIGDAIFQPGIAQVEFEEQKRELRSFIAKGEIGTAEYSLAQDQLTAIEAAEKLSKPH